MATAKRAARKTAAAGTVNINLPGAISEEEPNDPAPGTPDEQALEEILEQLPENTVAKIYRIREDGVREYVTQVAPQAATEERCAKSGVAGTYRIIFWGPKGDGTRKNGFRGQRTIYVGADAAAAAAEGKPAERVATGGLDTIMVTALVNMMNAQATQQREHSALMMAHLTKLGEPKPNDPLLMEIVKTSLASPKVDPIDQATRIAALNPPAAKSGAADIIATLDLVDRIRGDGNGSGDGEPRGWLAELVRAVAPEVAAIVKERMAPTPTPTPAALPPGQPERSLALVREEVPSMPKAPTPPVAPAPVVVVASYLQPVVPLLGDLVWIAERMFSPELAAEMILARINDDDLDMFAAILAKPTLTADIVAAEPRLHPYAAWLDNVKVEIAKQLEPGDDDDATPNTSAEA